MPEFAYQHLNDDGKAGIVRDRLVQFEGEHYQHTLNLAAVEENPNLTDEQKDQQAAVIEGMIETVERAIERHRAELVALEEGKSTGQRRTNRATRRRTGTAAARTE